MATPVEIVQTRAELLQVGDIVNLNGVLEADKSWQGAFQNQRWYVLSGVTHVRTVDTDVVVIESPSWSRKVKLNPLDIVSVQHTPEPVELVTLESGPEPTESPTWMCHLGTYWIKAPWNVELNTDKEVKFEYGPDYKAVVDGILRELDAREEFWGDAHDDRSLYKEIEWNRYDARADEVRRIRNAIQELLEQS